MSCCGCTARHSTTQLRWCCTVRIGEGEHNVDRCAAIGFEQERPCTRCIKRNIGHLCHDEPREHDSKKARGSTAAGSNMDETESQSDIAHSAMDQSTSAAVAAAMGAPSFDGGAAAAAAAAGITAGAAGQLGRGSSIQLVRPAQLSGMQASGLGRGNMNQCRSRKITQCVVVLCLASPKLKGDFIHSCRLLGCVVDCPEPPPGRAQLRVQLLDGP